ncbi:MAG: acyl carrier protein [Candidatus Latescibacteria bacterium]|nr:acyl carrier protein [Candidatus Latescibacterota bacterium]
MVESTTLYDQIGVLFSETLNIEVPSTETDLVDAGVLDSLAFVELLLHLERTFGLKVSTDSLEIDNFRSIARIADFITSRNGWNGHHKM